MKKIVGLSILLLCILSSYADVYKEVECNKAGQLSTLLAKEELSSITHLIVSGEINEADLVFLSELSKRPNLKFLDFEETTGGTNIFGKFNSSTVDEFRVPKKSTIESSFRDCTFTKMNWENVSNNLDSFHRNKSIKKLELPFSPYYSFHNCALLDTVIIQEGVGRIREGSFENCTALRYVQLPSTMKTMQNGTFHNCKALEEVVIYAEKVPEYDNEDFFASDVICFTGVDKDKCLLKVPFGTREAYASAWGFWRIQEMDAPEIPLIDWDTEYHTVQVETPGTLSTRLTSQALVEAKCMKVTGYINADDIQVLQDLIKNSKLRALDLGDCQLENDYIPARAFYNTRLEKIILPKTLKEIREKAFSQSYIKELIIPNDNLVEKIGEQAFYKNDSLHTTLVFPRAKRVGNESFSSCKRLKTISLGTSQSIENGVLITDVVEELGTSVFSDCPGIQSATLSVSFEELPTGLFDKCSNLKAVELPATLKRTGEQVFSKTGLRSIDIPAGVTEISDYCFDGCWELTQINFPPQIKMIGDYAFRECGFTQMNLPSTVRHLGEGWLSQCAEITQFQFPKNLTYIGSGGLEGCASLQQIAIPMDMTELPKRTFRHTGLKAINIPEQIKIIGDSCFMECDQLTTMALSAKLDSIGARAFYGTKLQEVSFRKGLKYIGLYAFSENQSLSQVHLPEGELSIDYGAFMGCKSLMDINLTDDVWLSGGVFSRTGLKTFTIPKRTTSIGDSFLKGCEKLEMVYFHAGITFVDFWALGGCTNLKEVYLQTPTPPETETYVRTWYEPYDHYERFEVCKPFDDVPKSCILYVPQESYYTYWNSGGLWKESFTLEGYDYSGIEESTAEVITLYPNPVGDMLYVKGVQEGEEIVLCNLSGQVVATATAVAGETTIDTADLPAGIYFCRIAGHTTKVVKR